MRQKLIVPIIILVVSAILSGCIFKPEDKLLPENYNKETINAKYLENKDPIITSQDFPNFKLLEHVYFISPDNVSLTLQSESVHMSGTINDSEEMPKGYRLYGGSESYNLSNRYILLQYKVYDSNESLNDSMDFTIGGYIKGGFKSKVLKNVSYKGRVFVFERNVANSSDMNVTVVLFGYDTVLGKIGVQDTRDESTNEALKILDMVMERLKVNTKKVVKMDLSSIPANISNMHANNSLK